MKTSLLYIAVVPFAMRQLIFFVTTSMAIYLPSCFVYFSAVKI